MLRLPRPPRRTVSAMLLALIGSAAFGRRNALAEEAETRTSAILHEKLIDWREIASELEAQLRRASSAIQKEFSSVPRVVGLAYTDLKSYEREGFGKNFEPVIEEYTSLAKRVGIVYDVDKVILNDPSSKLDDLRDRLSSLSNDRSVDGILIDGWGYMGSSLHDPRWIDPKKDIDCQTEESQAWLLEGHDPSRWWIEGYGPFVNPEVGSILKVLSYGLKRRPPSQQSVALLEHAPTGPYDNYLLTLLTAMLKNRALTIYVDPQPEDADRVRQADAIITGVERQGYLDGRYVRPGQFVIDLGGMYNWQVKSDVDLETVIPVIDAYANDPTVGNLKLHVLYLNAMRGFLFTRTVAVSTSGLFPVLESVATLYLRRILARLAPLLDLG